MQAINAALEGLNNGAEFEEEKRRAQGGEGRVEEGRGRRLGRRRSGPGELLD